MRLVNPEIRIEPTNRCNGSCIMCPRESMTRGQGRMGMDLYCSVLRQAVECGATKVALENYGEPLLDRLLWKRAAIAQSLGLETSTITNGALLTPAACRLVLTCFDSIRISLNAMSPETYATVQPGLDFAAVVENIETLLSLRHSQGSKTHILMSFVLLDENRHELQAFLDKYGPMVDGLSVWKPHNWSYGKRYREIGGAKATCHRPETGPVQVQWDGKVVPCCFDYDSRVVLGDLTKQTLEEVVTGPEYERLRAAHREGRFSEYPMCDSCDQLHKDDSALVYTNIEGMAVGTTCSGLFKL